MRLIRGPRRDEPVIGGWNGPEDALLLNDGRWLRITITLYIESTDKGPRLKVKNSNIQYQMDNDGDHWIFRYDYNRESPGSRPSSHFHIRGSLSEECLQNDEVLERLHFPTNRVSLEAVIRLLIEEFHVPSHSSPEVWRSLLAESEAAFLEIAHRSISGPDR